MSPKYCILKEIIPYFEAKSIYKIKWQPLHQYWYGFSELIDHWRRWQQNFHSNNNKKTTYILGFEVLTAASVKMTVLWVVTPWSLVEGYRHFKGTCCLHHHPVYLYCVQGLCKTSCCCRSHTSHPPSWQSNINHISSVNSSYSVVK
jgi:hypothetical protein